MRRRRTPPDLEIVPAGPVDDGLLRALGEDLQAALALRWRVGDAVPLRDEWMDGETGHCRSVHLMRALMEEGRGGRWRLAIADAGLCAAEVGPILGEAALGGRYAVVGLAPLRAGSGADADVLRGRLLTEALHELGHLAGVGHCGRASCVMYPSSHIADSDRKGTRFCASCAEPLKRLGIRKS